jgi:TP901 family phage tail tape measure protein
MAEGFSRVGDAALGLGTAMIAGSAALVGGMVTAARAAADFQSKLVLLQTHAGATSADMKELGTYILKVAGQLGFNPDSLAEAVYHVQSSLTSLPAAMQNVKTDEEILYRSAQLAAIGHADLEDSVNAVTKAFVAYQKDGYSAEQITAIFNKTIGEGNMRLQELNQAFATGLLPVAEQAGIKLESVGAALATMTDLGIPATRAATYLRSAIIQMSIPTGPAVDALKAIGVAANDAKSQVDTFSKVLVKAGVNQTDVSKELQKTGSLGDTLTWLDKKLKAAGLSSQDAGALMDKAFGGIRSGTGIVTLYNNLEGLVRKEKDAKDATAEWLQTWTTFTGSDPTFQLKQLNASWNSLVITLGYSFLPVALKVIETILPMVQNMGLWIATHQDLVAHMTESLAVFLAVGGAIMWFGGIVSKIIAFLIPIIEFVIEFAAQLEVAATAMTATGAAAGTAGEVITAAFGGPVGIAIAVIAALIAITILLVTHWDQVKAAAMRAWGTIAPYVATAVGYIRQIISVEMGYILAVWQRHHTQIEMIVSAAWSIIKVWIMGTLIAVAIAIGIVITVIVALVAIFMGLAVAALWVAAHLMHLASAIGGFVVTAWNVLSKFFSDLTREVFKVWNEFMDRPSYTLGYALGTIVKWTKDVIKEIGNFFNWLGITANTEWKRFTSYVDKGMSNAVAAVNYWLPRIPGIIGNFLSQANNTATREAKNIVSAIWNELQRLPGQVYNIGQDIVRGLRNGLFSLAGWIRGEAAEFVKGLVNGMRQAIKSGSPSLLAAEVIGIPISQGILVGMQNEQNNTQKGMNSLVTALPVGAGKAQGSVSANMTANQNTEIVLMLDDDVLAKAVDKRMTRWFKNYRLY